MALLLGVDTGGTFTDFVLLSEGELTIHKVLSTPDDPSRAILKGINDLGLFAAIRAGNLHLVHGSTVATNAALENKGVRTAYITNTGFTDILRIGRQARPELYALMPKPTPDPVPQELCLGTGGRINAKGELLEPLTDAHLQDLKSRIRDLKPEAIAINLLFSYLDDSYEKRIEAALQGTAFISRSSYVLPEYGEYERGIATWLNAWLGPLVQNYLGKLRQAVHPAPLAVMQSSGETIDASQAGTRAVNLLLSGPAGGLSAASYIGTLTNTRNIMTFDMGGTSTDVSLLVDQPILTNTGSLGPYPVAIPMIDIHTIGAGGGSIASIDIGGSLNVGPASAGANPGPACYGLGSDKATVTDANVVLGRLPAGLKLPGGIQLNLNHAQSAVQKLATELGLTLLETAQGIIELAEQHMVRALQVISIERGFDPRDFTLMCFGGAGGLHVCSLAKQLNISHVILPLHGGVLSAFGMLTAKPGRQLAKTVNKLLTAKPASTAMHNTAQKDAKQTFGKFNPTTDRELKNFFEALIEKGRLELLQEGHDPEGFHIQQSAALRYQGQSFTLNLPWQNSVLLIEAFHSAHHKRYGHNFDLSVEVVNIRIQIEAESPKPSLPPLTKSEHSLQPAQVVDDIAVYNRTQFSAGDSFSGAALIIEPVATSYIAAGWHCEVDRWGHLHLRM